MAYRGLSNQAKLVLTSISDALDAYEDEVSDARSGARLLDDGVGELDQRVRNAIARAEAALSASDRDLLRPRRSEWRGGADFDAANGRVAALERLVTEMTREARRARFFRGKVRDIARRVSESRGETASVIDALRLSHSEYLPLRMAAAERTRDEALQAIQVTHLVSLEAELRNASIDLTSYRPVDSIAPVLHLADYERSALGTSYRVPLLVELPLSEAVFFEASTRRSPAQETVRSFLAQLLLTHPPGDAQFVFIDAVNMGSTFAPFLSLADADERLIGGQAWVDDRRIEVALIEVADHVEKVIQKYLRDDFHSIAEFNREAGKVAEPYRFVGVADFPAGFTDRSMSLLRSIVENGPRCGVVPVVHANPDRAEPRHLDGLRGFGRWISEAGTSFVDSQAPPGWTVDIAGSTNASRVKGPLLNDAVEVIAEAAVSRDAVEVGVREVLDLAQRPRRRNQGVDDDDRIALDDPTTWWRDSSVADVNALVGRTGAADVAALSLSDPAPHALIVGRPGMGKSNLLHVLIHHWIMHYSPDELELYLVDFKTGLEFQTYARHRLPHARVVAIEAEREFGLAVLRSLVGAMNARGDAFRRLGAEDIADYRALGMTCPRTVLIVDEFHRLFQHDDALTEEAGRLLGRLIREGRAYGYHVILGSQQFGSLPAFNENISLISWRIAFASSESVSRTAFTDDNVEAASLARPGEAIFNHGAGRIESNRRVQVTFLPDELRDASLQAVRHRADQEYPSSEPRVFRGGAIPGLESCIPLRRALATGRGEADGLRLWLGEPLALGEIASLELRRASGSNLVIVGDEPQRDGLLLTALSAIVAQTESGTPRTQIDLVDFGARRRTDDPLDSFGARVSRVRSSDFSRRIADLCAEVDRRHDQFEGDEPDIVLIIRDVQRARGLIADTFEAPDETGEHLVEVLRSGPDVGVWVIVSADRVPNLERRIPDDAFNYLVWRVTGSLNELDAQRFLGSAGAVSLRPEQMVVANDDEGSMLKFTPYAWVPLAELTSDEHEIETGGGAG